MPRNEQNFQKSPLRLGASTRVTSKANFKINGVVSKTVVKELVRTLAVFTICLSEYEAVLSSWYEAGRNLGNGYYLSPGSIRAVLFQGDYREYT